MAKLEKQLYFNVKEKLREDIKQGIDYQSSAIRFSEFCKTQGIGKLKEITPEMVSSYLRTDPPQQDVKMLERIFTQQRFALNEKKRTDSDLRKNLYEKNKPLERQMHDNLTKQCKFGESKYEDKRIIRTFAKNNNLKVNSLKNGGIYSYRTYHAYKQTSIEFTRWMQEKHPNITSTEHIRTDHVREYLLMRQEKGLSKYTIDKDLAALNKVLGLSLTKKEIGLARKSYTEVVRSRKQAKMDRRYNPENYKNQILVAKATGIRRESMLVIQGNSFHRNFSGQIIAIHVKEKGGKEREAKVLDKYQKELTKVVDEIIAKKGSDKPLFEKYTTLIDNHAFRGQYAKDLYEQLLQQKGRNEKNYMGYDLQCTKEVSKNLGHERTSVVVYHYFR